MKKPILLASVLCALMMTSSCNLFKPKYGCPTNGKNIGAERLLSGDAASEKAARKAKKFKS